MNAFYKNWWQVMISKVFFNNAVQAFLDFRNFPFNLVYNSILVSSPLVLVNNLNLWDFFSCVSTLAA